MNNFRLQLFTLAFCLFSLGNFCRSQNVAPTLLHHQLKNEIIRSYAFNPLDQNQLIIGMKGENAGDGKVHFSNDAGKTFEVLNSGEALCDSCSDVQAVCFIDDKTFLAGTWKNGIYLSKDAGKSFKRIKGFPSNDIRSIKKSPSGIVYAATTTHGILKSEDQGRTWVCPHNADMNKTLACWSLEIAPRANNILYALTFGSGIYKSIDAGVTWKQVAYQDKVMIWDIAFVNNEMYAVGSDDNTSYLFHAYLGDRKWKVSKLNIDASVNSIGIQSNFRNYSILLGTWSSGLYKTYAIESSIEGYRCTELDASDTVGVTKILTTDQFIYNFSWGDGLKIYERELQCAVVVPEVFTPNSETASDWNITSNCKLDHLNFKLYDRWGEKVYQTNGGLDTVNHFMHAKSDELSEGVYVYWIKTSFESDPDTLSLKGHISIVK